MSEKETVHTPERSKTSQSQKNSATKQKDHIRFLHQTIGNRAVEKLARSTSILPQPDRRTQKEEISSQLRVFVIGSPSPDDIKKAKHPYQFIHAAICHGTSKNTVWIVEKTGYEAGQVDLGFIQRAVGDGRLFWLTPEIGLMSVLNTLRNIDHLSFYSHGLAGEVTLRYGWENTGRPNYGLTIAEVKEMNKGIFTPAAKIVFNSCNSATSDAMDSEGNLAQIFAQQAGRNVQGWTGRTSYSEINRQSSCAVGPSLKMRSWRPDIKEIASQYFLRRMPNLRTYTPLSGSMIGGFRSKFEIKARLPNTRFFEVPENGAVRVTCPNPEMILPEDMPAPPSNFPGTFWVALYKKGLLLDDSLSMYTFPVEANQVEAIWTNLSKGTYYLEIYRFTGNTEYSIRSEIDVQIYSGKQADSKNSEAGSKQ